MIRTALVRRDDGEQGRPVQPTYHASGWVERRSYPVRLPPWFPPIRLVVRTHQATGAVTLALEGVQVE